MVEAEKRAGSTYHLLQTSLFAGISKVKKKAKTKAAARHRKHA